MKPNYIYIIRLKTGEVFDCIFLCHLHTSSLVAALPFFGSVGTIKRFMDDSEIEWSEEIMQYGWETTESAYHRVLAGMSQ